MFVQSAGLVFQLPDNRLTYLVERGADGRIRARRIVGGTAQQAAAAIGGLSSDPHR